MTASVSSDGREEWRPIAGFDGYEVSSFGRVRSWRRRGVRGCRGVAGRRASSPAVITPALSSQGYQVVSLGTASARATQRLVHRLVLEAFEGPAPANAQGCHADGCRTNNRISNLRWGTARENQADKIKQGRSKLSLDMIRDVRARPATESSRAIARELQMAPRSVRMTRARQWWAGVE